MVKLYIKENYTGEIREYGTNCHDSLILNDDGSIHYYNLQCGEGTLGGNIYPDEGFSFCAPDGSDPRKDEDYIKYGVEPFLDIGGIKINTPDPDKKPDDFVTEVCPHCEFEALFMWNVGKYGLSAFCPHCGGKMMLCGACEINCDWDDETRTCSGEMRKGEANNG